MEFQYQDLIKLCVSLLLGGIIGAERERYKKDAGLRTTILISIGSTLFTILSERVGGGAGINFDTSRIAANVVSGIGFLGAGVILQEHGRVKGSHHGSYDMDVGGNWYGMWRRRIHSGKYYCCIHHDRSSRLY